MEIIDRTEMTARFATDSMGRTVYSRYGRARDLSQVDGIMLHQMGFDRGNDLSLYDRVIAHYIVTRNGTIGLVRPLTALLNDARARKSVHIEFAGNYPNHTGRQWQSRPSMAQIRAGRRLVRHIVEASGLTIHYILAHRQWNPSGRARDPGPHLWYNVAVWAKDSLSLSSSPPERCPGDIPAAWESARFDVDPHGLGNVDGWMAFVRHVSRAIGVKLHDGGIIGIYASQGDANNECGEGRPWAKGPTWECWIRRHSAAREAELISGGIAAFYENRRAAEEEADPEHAQIVQMHGGQPVESAAAH